MKQGKNIKCWIGRADLIGDCIMALPMLNYIERLYPNSYKIWPILRKCSQAAPLFFNNPWIDKIHISDLDEGFGECDKILFDSCDLKLNVRPQHKFENWHNVNSMCLETWLMGGLPEHAYHLLPEEEKIPTLYKWFNTEKREKTIAIHCFAGYGRDNQRSPSIEWWEKMICLLWDSGYEVIRLGHPNEPDFFGKTLDWKLGTIRKNSFIEQIQLSLGCSAYIGTDSGFSLAMGAYSHPQISLITNWNVNHTENPFCLQPLNKNNISLFNEFKEGGCSGINQELALEKLKLLI
jgi:ADP-heptose:LPS heptosyltransferase